MTDIVAAAQSAMLDLHKELKGVKPTFKAPVEEPVESKSVLRRKERSGVSPVTAYVRSLPGGPYFTALEVAQQLGCSVQAIRKYAKNKVTQAPSYEAPFGKLVIYLYTKEDVQALKDYIGNRRQVFPTQGTRPEPPALKNARTKP